MRSSPIRQALMVKAGGHQFDCGDGRQRFCGAGHTRAAQGRDTNSIGARQRRVATVQANDKERTMSKIETVTSSPGTTKGNRELNADELDKVAGGKVESNRLLKEQVRAAQRALEMYKVAAN
jgi:hypothetical protein